MVTLDSNGLLVGNGATEVLVILVVKRQERLRDIAYKNVLSHKHSMYQSGSAKLFYVQFVQNFYVRFIVNSASGRVFPATFVVVNDDAPSHTTPKEAHNFFFFEDFKIRLGKKENEKKKTFSGIMDHHPEGYSESKLARTGNRFCGLSPGLLLPMEENEIELERYSNSHRSRYRNKSTTS